MDTLCIDIGVMTARDNLFYRVLKLLRTGKAVPSLVTFTPTDCATVGCVTSR